MAATYHHARRLYIGTTAERAAVVLDVDGIGTDYWDTDVGVLYIWDGTAWVAGFAALPHSILSATHDDTTPAVVVRGDLMTGQGVAPLWQRLAHPGALYHLQTDANDVIWSQDIIMADDSHIGGTGLLDGRIIFDYTPAPDEIHVADATLVMDTSHILPAGAGQDLGSGVARWDVFAAFVDLPGAGWIGVGPASERLIFNVAGDATFAGVTSVVVPDDCWVGADAACSWVFDSSNGDVTTLDDVGIGIAAPIWQLHIDKPGVLGNRVRIRVGNSDAANVANKAGFDFAAMTTVQSRTFFYLEGNLSDIIDATRTSSVGFYHYYQADDRPAMMMYGNSVVFNEDADDVDFRVEGVGEANALFVQGSDGNVGMGTAVPAASAKLELSSTTGALLLTRMTTAQRNALGAVNGMVIYNTTTATVEAYEAGAWVNL